MLKWNQKILFYVRLLTLLLVLSFLICDLIWAIINPLVQFENLGYSERAANYYAFFTTQSNYIVALYFFTYLFESRFKHRKPTYVIKLAVTTYITVTMLVFWMGLFTDSAYQSQFDLYSWISTIMLHLIIPIVMITSYVLTSGDFKYNIKQHHKFVLWIILIYPFLYLLIIVIRGNLRHLDQRPEDSWYPYFFFYVNQPLGWIILIGAIIIIFGLFVGLQYLFIFLNNFLYLKYKGKTLNKHVNEKIFGIKDDIVLEEGSFFLEKDENPIANDKIVIQKQQENIER